MDTYNKTMGIFSLRNRILLFAVLVTLVPSFGMGRLFYLITYRATADMTEQKLKASVDRVGYTVDLWLKERHHDLLIFASSFIISNNLTQYYAQAGKGGGATPLKRIVAYLNLIKSQYIDYDSLVLLDAEGKVIAASDSFGADHPLSLPADWKRQIQTFDRFVGVASSPEGGPAPVIVIGIPLPAGPAVPPCLLAMEVSPEALKPLLKSVLDDREGGIGEILFVQEDGRLMLTVAQPEGGKNMLLEPGRKTQLLAKPYKMQKFLGQDRIVGLAVWFKDFPWGCLIAKDYDAAFAGVMQLQDQITLAAILFSLVIGVCASIVAGQIILPLKTLTRGVLRVGSGELDVSLPVRRNDEFGIVTGMFNQMVIRLKKNQCELEQLATTDSLTGLVNRKQIMTVLNTHIEQYRRYASEFSLLMIDIDHFKMINDSHGHLVGDQVLSRIGQIFRHVLRTMDVAGRYGGEEFMIILGKTDSEEAMATAERIRQAVEAYPFMNEDLRISVTISIGVVEILGKEDTEASLIGRADSALYEAKAQGRNRAVLGGPVSRIVS